MRLVTYNIQYSLGRDGRYDLMRQAELVGQADIIALQEVERHWLRTGEADQVAALSAALPDRHVAYGPGLDVDASRMVDGHLVNRRRQFGNMTLSRWPILSVRNFPLPKIDLQPQFNLVTAALETVIDAPGGPLRLINLHLAHACPKERLVQLAAVKAILDRTGTEGGAWSGAEPGDDSWANGDKPPPLPADIIMMGDFNAEPTSDEYRMVTDPDGLGLVDCLVASGGRTGVTFFRDPDQGTYTDQRIDYIFVSPGHASRIHSVRIDEDTRFSDHQPVWLELGV